MTALLQGKIRDDKVNFDQDGPIVAHCNGFPYTDKGGIAISAGPVDHYHQGIPFDANGRMVMIAGSVNYWGSGAAPFNPGPEVAFGSVLDHYSSGVPYTPGGALIAGAVPLNELSNTSWDGASGSVGGGDFVTPTGWDTGFWPPDDAIVIDNGTYNSIRFIANDNRGFLVEDLGNPFPVGTRINVSINVDECLISTGAQRIFHMNTQGGTNPIEIRRVVNVSPGFTGRIDAVYEITDAVNNLQLRVGPGTTANDNKDITLSRPQITVGEVMWPYQPTPLYAGPLYTSLTGQGTGALNARNGEVNPDALFVNAGAPLNIRLISVVGESYYYMECLGSDGEVRRLKRGSSTGGNASWFYFSRLDASNQNDAQLTLVGDINGTFQLSERGNLLTGEFFDPNWWVRVDGTGTELSFQTTPF